MPILNTPNSNQNLMYIKDKSVQKKFKALIIILCLKAVFLFFILCLEIIYLLFLGLYGKIRQNKKIEHNNPHLFFNYN